MHLNAKRRVLKEVLVAQEEMGRRLWMSRIDVTTD